MLQPIAIVELQDCTLRHFIENEPDLEIEAKIKLITDILDGIATLHDQGLVHSDMKPENILINKSGQRPSAKIGDFGYSVQTYYGSRSFGTTIDWASPESHSAASPIVVGENAAMQLGIDPHAPILSLHNNIDYTKVEEFQARDMFSLGLVAFFILKGELPFGKSEITRSHDDWLALKLEAQQIMDSWMKRKFRTPRIHPIPHEHYDSDSSLDSTLDPTRVWEMRLDSPNVTQWMVIPERVPMLGLTSIPRTLLSVDPKERLTASQLREVFRFVYSNS